MNTTTPNSNQIGLYIAGTQKRQGGFNSLVIIHPFPWTPEYDKEMDRAPLVNEKPAFSIKHKDNVIIYNLLDSFVKPCDAATMGRLTISLSIPKGKCLAEGKSPYTLLMEIYEVFKANYMKHIPSANYDTFSDFDTAGVDRSMFTNIIAKYSLDDMHSKYMPMNPLGKKGVLCVDKDKLAILFSDSMYDEFEQFSEIEIGSGEKTKSSAELEDLEIPRRKKYTIIVNGERTSRKLVNATDEFFTADITHDDAITKYYNYEFTLNDLLNSPNKRLELGNGNSVELDNFNNEIDCTVGIREKYYELTFAYDGDSRKFFEEKVAQNKVYLIFDGDKLPVKRDSGEVSSKHIPIKNVPPIRIEKKFLNRLHELKIGSVEENLTKPYKIEVITEKNEDARQIVCTIIVNKKTKQDLKAEQAKVAPSKNIGGAYSDFSNPNNQKDSSKIKIIVTAIAAAIIIVAVVLIINPFASDNEFVEEPTEGVETEIVDSTEEPSSLEQSHDSLINDTIIEEHLEDIQKEDIQKEVEQKETKKKEKTSDEYRKDILDLVNKGNIVEVRKLNKYLSKDELLSIEAALGNVEVNFKNAKTPAAKVKLKKVIKESKPFKSIDEIVQLRNKLIQIESESNE